MDTGTRHTEGAGHTEPAREAEGKWVGHEQCWLLDKPSTLPALTTRLYLEVFHHILQQEEMNDVF